MPPAQEGGDSWRGAAGPQGEELPGAEVSMLRSGQPGGLHGDARGCRQGPRHRSQATQSSGTSLGFCNSYFYKESVAKENNQV